MLIISQTIAGFSFSKLMEVYTEGNMENAEELWPDLSEGEKLLRAEQEFYQYLNEVFFPTSGAVYAVWEENGNYVSALRLEPYRDGLLLEALETAPEQRRKGYGHTLVCAVLARYGGTKMYSHVGKWNEASLRLHEKCGFRRVAELAVYIDGSVNNRCCTLCFEA